MSTDVRYDHSSRFRRVSTGYPRRVAEAYEGDLDRAAAASDEEVALDVAAWERAQGWEPVDWVGIGLEERAADPAWVAWQDGLLEEEEASAPVPGPSSLAAATGPAAGSAGAPERERGC
jgi:hypothetical protein